MSKSLTQEAHEARIAAMRKEHDERMLASRIEHEKVMAEFNAKLAVIEQRNLEGLISWLEQKATSEQVATIIGKINQGEV